MPLYGGKQIFTHGSFPEVGENQKAEKKKKKKKKEKKKKVAENNGQLRFVRHHVWRTQARLDQNVLNWSPVDDRLTMVLALK